jgi:hypothetical protein
LNSQTVKFNIFWSSCVTIVQWLSLLFLLSSCRALKSSLWFSVLLDDHLKVMYLWLTAETAVSVILFIIPKFKQTWFLCDCASLFLYTHVRTHTHTHTHKYTKCNGRMGSLLIYWTSTVHKSDKWEKPSFSEIFVLL